jgi:cobaltochelatase CobT
MTTKFDVVREEINANNIAEINEIRKLRAKEIAKVTEVLKAKFKFKQKPKFRSAREEGSLCPRDLYQIPQGLSTQIFEELYKKPDSKVRVAIAIDISGSMDKEEMGHGRKLKELAVVLSDSLAAAHVKHEVLGYGAPVCPDMQDAKGSKLYNRTIHNLETIVYRNLSGASGLGNIDLQPWDNSDGESLRVVAKRMGKEKSKKKVMFVVSDSKPFLTDSDVACLDQDLRNAIKEAKAQGIEVVGIGWNKQGKEFYGDKYCDMKDEFDSLVKFLGEKIQPVR